MATNWQRLIDLLPEEHREKLAADLLEALGYDGWGLVEVKIRDHHIHSFFVGRSELAPRPALATAMNVTRNVTCKE